MSITTVLILALAGLLIGLLPGGRLRTWIMAAACILAVYWLQPSSPIRGIDFWLPTLSLAITAASWLATTPVDSRHWKTVLPGFIGLAMLVVVIALTRYVSFEGVITSSRPPAIGMVLLGLAVIAPGISLVAIPRYQKAFLALGLGFLLVLFIIQKTPALASLASESLRSLTGQDPSLARTLDWRWLGFSYIAFRLIHTIRDRQQGRLPVVSFPEYLVYVLFFPALPAGPLDRLERFTPDLRVGARLDSGGLVEGGRRVLLGLFKKFVLADMLSLVALNPQNAIQVHSAGWAWVLVYAFAFQIYFDFSGYTDIAIGVGRWMGIHLPENFSRPYQQPNLTRFWNSWHMTLTQWIRSYYFNPLTRNLLKGGRFPAYGVLLFGQVTTMLAIGLWHGITWNFLLWGLWHGVGLFVQNRWSNATKRWVESQSFPSWAKTGYSWLGVLVTFHYVALGWVWFVLPNFATTLQVFLKLAG